MNHMLLRSQAFINGVWQDARDQRSFPVYNPATGALVGTVPDMGRDDTCEAIDAAHAAWPAWRERTAKERAEVLRRWFTLILDHRDALAELMSRESGKVIAESRGEVTYGAAFVEWFA